MAVAQIAFTERFWPSANALDGNDIKRVVKAVTQLGDDPNHPSLNLHPVNSDPSGVLHTARASQDLRILLAKQGNVYLLDRAGRHDTMYELADRTKFVLNAGLGSVRIIETTTEVASSPLPAAAMTDEAARIERSVFDHWADSDLREAGFDPDEVSELRICATEDDLLGLPWDDETVARAIDVLGQTPEQWRTPSIDPTAEAEQRVRDAITRGGGLFGISQLYTPEEIAHLAQAPIEEWMVFLHPDQRAVAERRFDGPARVRGAAGTGKTVVALHRAVALTKRFAEEEPDAPPILFTTYINSLPPIFERLYHRLPGSVTSAVDFTNVDKLARRVCEQAGEHLVTSPPDINAAFASACRRVLTSGSPLVAAELTRRYLKEEIDKVIVGRGVRTLDEYLGMERTGRRTRFTAPLRQHLWELKEAFESELSTRGTVDFGDVILRARDHARRRATPMYRAALIDEAQDLTLAGLQLVRALVNGPEGVDRPDGLFIVGDGAQKIYAGGFSLRQAGVEVRGRTTILKLNYRNTAEILNAAMAVAGKADVEDLDEQYVRQNEDAEARRSYPTVKPVLVLASSWGDEMRFVASQIEQLVATGALKHGDIAVCVTTNRQVEQALAVFDAAGVPSQDLAKYAGLPNDLVKVGTHFRAKGLEFKVVFLPALGAADFPRPPVAGQDPLEYDEQASLAISQLFVAMTRARDGLFLLASGDPSPVVEQALDAFEVVTT